MRFDKSPETFSVEEVLNAELGAGKYYYYVLEKKGISTHNAVKLLEKESDARIFVSGLKDAAATTMQWICSEKKLAGSDKRMELLFMGNSNVRIYAGMHTSNRFMVVLDDVNVQEMELFEGGLRKMELPNYFDEQRFSPRTLEIAEFMLEGKWKEAVKAALTEPSEFESEKSREMKGIIAEKWGEWKGLAENERLPLPKRKIFELLAAEEDFMKAFEMLPRKAIGIYCRACQGLRFNEMLAKEIDRQNQKGQRCVSVAGRKLPVVFKYKAMKRELEIDAVFPSRTVLKRKTFLSPKNMKVELISEGHGKESARKKHGKESAGKEHGKELAGQQQVKEFAGKHQGMESAGQQHAGESGKSVRLKFELKKGCYATMLVKCIIALSGSDGKK